MWLLVAMIAVLVTIAGVSLYGSIRADLRDDDDSDPWGMT